MSLGHSGCHCLGPFEMGADGLQASLHYIVDPSRWPSCRRLGLLVGGRGQHAAHIVTMYMFTFFDFGCRNANRKSVSVDPVAGCNVTNGNLMTEWNWVRGD
jgi:hypothetical protein